MANSKPRHTMLPFTRISPSAFCSWHSPPREYATPLSAWPLSFPRYLIRLSPFFLIEPSLPGSYPIWVASIWKLEEVPMRHTNIVRTLALILPLACFLALPLVAQDSQDDSVAEAARRAREQKKASTKPATVITNETLSPAPASSPATSPAPGAEPATPAGQQPAATANTSSATPGSDASAQKTPATPEDAEQKKKEMDSLKQELAALQNEVDLAQRSLALDQDAFYSKPDSSDNKEGKAKLDAELADLKLKQEDLAQLKAKLAELGFVEEPKTPASPPKP